MQLSIVYKRKNYSQIKYPTMWDWLTITMVYLNMEYYDAIQNNAYEEY